MNKGLEQKTMSTKATVVDDVVESIQIIYTLKPGHTVKGSDSFFAERALLSYINSHIFGWVKYIRDNKMVVFQEECANSFWDVKSQE